MLAIRDLMREVGGQLQPACPSCGKTLWVTRPSLLTFYCYETKGLRSPK